MDNEKKKEALRAQLNEAHNWPSLFMFKFIIPNDEQKLLQVRQLFNESAEIRERLSKNGNYVSLTVREVMLEADHIFDRYEAASKIEGLISL